jgi:hypothetical protein
MCLPDVHQLEIGVVHEARGVQGRVGSFAPKPVMGKAAEFAIDEWDEIVQSIGVTLAPSTKQPSDL